MRKPQHFDVKEAKLNKPESPVIIGYADDFKHAQVQFYFRYKYKNDKKSLRFETRKFGIKFDHVNHKAIKLKSKHASVFFRLLFIYLLLLLLLLFFFFFFFFVNFKA